jgi:trk system potassium uptake protein TrkA
MAAHRVLEETMHIIIGGCGRVGVQMAERLSEEGHDIVVVDSNDNAFHRLGVGFQGDTLVGDVTSQSTLRAANAERADVVAAVTPEDNANLMTVEIARELFGVPRTVARLFNPEREESYRKMGVHYVSETRLVAKALLNELHVELFPQHIAFEDVIHDVTVVDMAVSRGGHGLSIAELERNGNVRVAAVRRGRRVTLPKPNDTVLMGDVVVAAIAGNAAEDLRRVMCDPVDAVKMSSARR